MYGRQPAKPPSSPAAPGPSRPVAKVLWALVPLLSCSLLAFAPAVYLAVRRRRARDWAGVVFFAGVSAALMVATQLAAKPGQPYNAGDAVGMTALGVGCLLGPAHFLLMDREREWYGPPGPPPQAVSQPPYPGYGYPAPYQQPGAYQPQPQAYLPPQPQPYVETQPGPQTVQPDDAARAELRELGELLRRQAAGDGTRDPRPGGGR